MKYIVSIICISGSLYTFQPNPDTQQYVQQLQQKGRQQEHALQEHKARVEQLTKVRAELVEVLNIVQQQQHNNTENIKKLERGRKREEDRINREHLELCKRIATEDQEKNRVTHQIEILKKQSAIFKETFVNHNIPLHTPAEINTSNGTIKSWW